MTPDPRRVTDAMLERYVADALDAEAKARIEAALASSPELQARVAELRADSGAFLVRHPPGPLVARFREERRRAQWWRPVLLVPALVAAALVLVLLTPIEDPYTAKGPVLLVLHRKVGESSRPVSPDVSLVPHDSLRFEVKASTSGFVAVLGRDARGTVTVYHPFGGESAAPYDATQPLLPGAIELDDTLGREDLYVLHSEQPFRLQWAVEALKKGQPLEETAPREVSVGHASFMKKLTLREKDVEQELANAPGTMPDPPPHIPWSPNAMRDLESQLVAESHTTVELNPDGEAVVLDTLDPKAMRKAGIGLLTLATVPPAAVYDGQTSLGSTPLRKVPLQAGTYRLRLVDPDGISRLFSAPIELAKEKKYTVRLSDLPLYSE